MAYDHLLTFSDEVRTTWKKTPSMATGVFFINRYFALAGYFAVIYFKFIPPCDSATSSMLGNTLVGFKLQTALKVTN